MMSMAAALSPYCGVGDPAPAGGQRTMSPDTHEEPLVDCAPQSSELMSA